MRKGQKSKMPLHMKYQCIEYWLYRGYTEEEGRKQIRMRNKGTLEYYTEFKKIPYEQAIKMREEHGKRIAMTKENMISKYGEQNGLEKWNNYCEKQRIKNTLDFKKQKYGWSNEQFDNFNKSRAVTLKNLIKKHGEPLGKTMWDAYKDRQGYTNTLEYFIELYGTEKGTEKYKKINFLKSHTFESYLERFDGDVLLAKNAYNNLIKKYKDRKLKWYSSISIELFEKLKIILELLGYKKIFYYKNNDEKLFCDGKKAYFVDFYLEETKKVIEFYGDYWHANPKIYKDQLYISLPQGKILVDDIQKRDTLRIEYLKNNFDIKDIKIIWEYDYRNNENDIIKDCINFLTKDNI